MPKKLHCISVKSAVSLLFGVCILLIFFTPIFAERLSVKTYTVADGLLRDNVYKIKQDSRGFLWFCSVEGISRFDGYAFRNFTTVDGLPDRHVNDFLETRSGDIWIATDGGLAKLNPRGLAGSAADPLFVVLKPDNSKTIGFQVLFEDHSGAIWAGTRDGLYKVDGGTTFIDIDLEGSRSRTRSISVSSIIQDRRGTMWIGTNGGISRIAPDGRVDRYTIEDGLPGSNVSILYEDNSGRIWAGFRAGRSAGLVILRTDVLEDQNIVERHFTERDGLPANWITDLRETSDGKFWVATTEGLCEWQTDQTSVCKTYTTKNDLCDRDVWTISEDKDKSLWIGSRCGAKKWARYGFTSYTEADGTGYPLANSIFENSLGDLFVSFNTGRERTVSRFDGERFELVKPNIPPGVNYFGWGWKQTILQDRVGQWWFPTGGGLYRSPRATGHGNLSRLSAEKVITGAKGNEVFRIFEDARSDIWMATTGSAVELFRWDRGGDTWHDVTQETGIGANRLVTAFVEDASGNMWISTASDNDNSALIRYRGGKFEVFTQAENGSLAGWTRDLFVDHAGRLWLANTTTGLLRLDDVNAERPDFVRYTPVEGLSSIGVSCITEDEFGRIYVGTGRGLDRLDPQTGQVENFTTADGLPGSYLEVAYRDRNNTLWFGTSNGVARFVPEPVRDRHAPNVLLTGLRINGEPQSVSILGENVIPDLELDSHQRQVTIDFLGLGASLGEKLKYEYKLGGSDWTATNERTVNFANLNADSYLFEVRAITADRIYSQPATLAFRVAAPIWQRWWFAVGSLILIAFVFYVFYRYRVGQLLEFERMRTRIATDLHDDVGSNLTRIALLSEVANQQSTPGIGNGNQSLLPSIAEIARESVASMNDIVWAISPEHDSLLDLTRRMRRHAEEVFSFREIDLELHAPISDAELKLSIGIRRDLLLIFKEAVNNVAKHAACRKVCIDLRQEDSVLKMLIKDDGKGFETDSESEGQGLRSMARRAAVHGGKLNIDSNGIDGTRIEIELPLPKHGFESRL